MNPFDLPGPAFLFVYAFFAAAVIAVACAVILRAEDGEPPSLPVGDPYPIGWLRGGTAEVVRLAVLSLTERGFLVLRDRKLVATGVAPGRGELPPIEAAVLGRCNGSGSDPAALLSGAAVERAGESYRRRLEASGLVPDDAARQRRLLVFGAAAALLLAVGLVKLWIASERGRSNVLLLILMMTVALAAVRWRARRRSTERGDRVLADLRQLLSGLKARAWSFRPAEATSDTILLAAVFGLGALPAAGYGDLQRVYQKSSKGSGGCGAACGSGCGGGDGGGGCGGCGS